MSDKTEVGQSSQSVNTSSHRAAWAGGIIAVLIILITVTVANLTKGTLKKTTSRIDVISPVNVSVTKDGFMPATINTKAGTTVTWTNNDTTVHQVAADPFPKDDSIPGFDSQQSLQPKDTTSFTFSKAGTYTYHDEKNPFEIKGVIVVQ